MRHAKTSAVALITIAAAFLGTAVTAATHAPSQAPNQETEPMPDAAVTIPHSHRHVLASKHVGREIEVWVAEPVAGPFPLPEGPRAVLYVLDADLFFGTAVETSRLMSQLYGELPPLLVVGIAYGEEPARTSHDCSAATADLPTPAALRSLGLLNVLQVRLRRPRHRAPDQPPSGVGARRGHLRRFATSKRGISGPALQSQLRTRDFTPSADPGYDRMVASMPGFEPLLPEGERMGGADRFLAFVREELQPFVAERYDVAPGEAGVYGSSLGGLFAAYTLLRAPETFSRYLIASPALWWNGSEVLALTETLDRADLDARVYLAAGSREEDPAIPMLAPYKLVTNTRELGRRLEAKDLPSLRVSVDILEGETHTSAVPVSMARGLRAAYGGT